jgi:DNA-binding transcriptional MerR regulator
MTTELKIGQLAKQVGVNIETIRYYERLNLLGPTSRLPSGYRLYNSEAQRRLRFIKNAQALGFTLHEIVRTPAAGMSNEKRRPSCNTWKTRCEICNRWRRRCGV